MRQGLIKQIAKTYITKYTCAMMADRFADVEKETAEANDKLFIEINELHITKSEMKKAVEEIEKESAKSGTACLYDKDLFSTKFFRS